MIFIYTLLLATQLSLSLPRTARREFHPGLSAQPIYPATTEGSGVVGWKEVGRGVVDGRGLVAVEGGVKRVTKGVGRERSGRRSEGFCWRKKKKKPVAMGVEVGVGEVKAVQWCLPTTAALER